MCGFDNNLVDFCVAVITVSVVVLVVYAVGVLRRIDRILDDVEEVVGSVKPFFKIFGTVSGVMTKMLSIEAIRKIFRRKKEAES